MAVFSGTRIFCLRIVAMIILQLEGIERRRCVHFLSSRNHIESYNCLTYLSSFHDKPSCPHGLYTILPIFILVAAFLMSLWASMSCKFLYRPQGTPNEFGFFSFYDQNTTPDYIYCMSWNKPWSGFDVWFNAAKTFSAIAATIGGLIMCGVFLTCCCSCGRVLAYWGTWGMVIAFLCQGFTMLIFASKECHDQNCSLNIDGIFSAVATVLWFLGAVIVSQLPVFLTDENVY